MSRLSIQNAINGYQRSRLCFAQTMSNMADKPLTRAYLKDMDVLDLLMPLLSDKIPSIQQAALATVGKMICAKELDMSEEVRQKGLIRLVLKDLSRQTKHYRRTALHMIGCAVHDPAMAELIRDQDLKNIILCLEELEPDARASAALALSSLCKDNDEIASILARSSALKYLVQLLVNPELSLKQAAANALGNIAKHDIVYAKMIADYDVIPLLVKATYNEHSRLKADALHCLANIAKHSPELATQVADNGINEAIVHLTYENSSIQKNAATLVRDICRHNLRLCNMVLAAHGLRSLISLVKCNNCSALPAIMALGYMSTMSEQIADQIIQLDAVHSLQSILQCEGKEPFQAAAAWALGQIGKHSVDNTNALSEENVIATLVEKLGNPETSENLKIKCRTALGLLLPNCEDSAELETMLMGNLPESLIAPILATFAKILKCYPQKRLRFVTSGCLRKIQELEPDKKMTQSIQRIIECFPLEVVHYVSPSYFNHLISTVDSFVPKSSAGGPKCQNTPDTVSPDPVSVRSMPKKSTIIVPSKISHTSHHVLADENSPDFHDQ